MLRLFALRKCNSELRPRSEIDLLRASLHSEEARIILSQSELDDVSNLRSALEEVHESAEQREISHEEESRKARLESLALVKATLLADENFENWQVTRRVLELSGQRAKNLRSRGTFS